MLSTVGVVILAVVVGAFLGLLTAWPAWTREARQRYIEAMVARGEIERQANRISFLEGRVRQSDSEVKHLNSELESKDLLNEGLKIGMAQLRDRLSDAERELGHALIQPREGIDGDGTIEQLRERVGELEPLSLQLAERDREIRRLERLASQLDESSDELRNEIAARDSDIEELQQRVTELEPLVERLAVREAAQEQVAQVKAEVEHREDRIRRLEAGHREALDQKDRKIEALRQRVSKLEPLVARLAERETQLSELEAKLRESNNEQRRLMQEHRLAVETREAQIETLRDEVGELTPLREQLTARDEQLRELEFLETQLSELEELDKRLREREARVNELERQHLLSSDDKDREITRLRERIGELAPLGERLERRNEEVRKLERALEDQRGETERSRRGVEETHARMVETKEQEVTGLRERVQEIQEECANRVRERDDALHLLQERVSQLEGVLEQTERERAEVAANLLAGDRELDKLRKRLAHLQPRSKGARSRTRSGGASASRARAPRDNLKRIRGIGPALERKLNALGCHTFADIVAWEPAEIEQIAQVVRASPKRIKSEWVKQARQYARRDGQTV